MTAADAGARDIWSTTRGFAVLGAGTALPGEPISTEELLGRIASRFGVDVRCDCSSARN
jgi:hypothetical protein